MLITAYVGYYIYEKYWSLISTVKTLKSQMKEMKNEIHKMNELKQALSEILKSAESHRRTTILVHAARSARSACTGLDSRFSNEIINAIADTPGI
jgi:phage shock protein A